MFSDDVESIRAAVVFGMGWAESEGASDGMEQIEALAALDRLAAEASRYREALQHIASHDVVVEIDPCDAVVLPSGSELRTAALGRFRCTTMMRDAARAALAGVQDPPGQT